MKYGPGLKGKLVVQLRARERLVRRFELDLGNPPAFILERLLNQILSTLRRQRNGRAEQRQEQTQTSNGCFGCYDRLV